MNYTHGPWTLAKNGTIYADDYRKTVVRINGPDPSTEDDANARLIAAAPELLEALEDLELRATQARLASTIGKQSGQKQADFLRRELERIGQAARAAIRAAEGRE